MMASTALVDGRSARQARVIETPNEWRRLEPQWSELLAATPGATPWQSWECLDAWWRHRAGDRQLRVTVVERAGRPCLILPLQIAPARMLRRRLRMLEPIGMPDDINRPALGLGPRDGDALRCALAALWSRRGEWDALRVDEKTADDDEVRVLREFAAARGALFRMAPLHPCPRLDLRQDWPQYLAIRGRRLAKNLRAGRRRLEAMGPLRLERAETVEGVREAFEVFLDIQSRSWKHDAGIGLSQSENYRRYVRRFVTLMANKGAARILILYCGEQPVAGTIAVTDRDTYYSAHIAHDQSYDRISPGTLLEAMELEGLMNEQRFESYDFLGAALNNKRRWTDTADSTCRVLLMRKTLENRLIDSYYFVAKPTFKRWLQKRTERRRDSRWEARPRGAS